MTDKQLTLADFSRKVLHPSVLQAIASGRIDNVLLDPDVLSIIADDPELLAAFVKRIPALKEKYGA